MAHVGMIPLRTARMLLRGWSPDDRAAVAAHLDSSRDHLRPWLARVPGPDGFDAYFDEQLERSVRGLEQGTAVRLVVLHPDTAEMIGAFNLNNITRGAYENADAGWLVGARHVGQGLASEGVMALLDIAFAARPLGLGLHRVQANVMPHNAASLRVCAKCGFRVEGLALGMLNIDGKWRDHLMHAKLADEHRSGAK